MYLPKRIKSSRSATHARKRSRGRTAAPTVSLCLSVCLVGRTHVCTQRYALTQRVHICTSACPAIHAPCAHLAASRRRFVITAGSHGRICIFPRAGSRCVSADVFISTLRVDSTRTRTRPPDVAARAEFDRGVRASRAPIHRGSKRA